MADKITPICDQKFCTEHPHTVERLASMEATIGGISETIRAGVVELKEMRAEVKGRPPWAVVAVISFLGSALGIVSTILVTHLMK